MLSLVVVTGLSGAGKSTATKILEDQGFYIIDNMPVPLIDKFFNVFFDLGINASKIVLVIDSRSGDSGAACDIIKQLKEKSNARVLFLKASTPTLIKRYKENRRKHPMGRDEVTDSIEEEISLMSNIEDISDYIIDTTNMTVHDLAAELNELFDRDIQANMQITLCSFGFKHGLPLESDLVFDVRFLKNPHFVEGMRYRTGKEQDVAEYVFSDPSAEIFVDKLSDMLNFLIPQYRKEGKHYLMISIGCTGGRHRSVAIVERLNKILYENNWGSSVKHRDISK